MVSWFGGLDRLLLVGTCAADLIVSGWMGLHSGVFDGGLLPTYIVTIARLQGP
jgi:hypothetical protein